MGMGCNREGVGPGRADPPSEPGSLDRAITHLRRLVEQAQDYSNVTDYLTDVLAARDDFMEASLPASYPALLATLRALLRHAGLLERFDDALVLHLPSFGLWHGAQFHAGRHAAVFTYFEPLGRGVVTVARLGSADVDSLRFTVPPGPLPLVEPEQIHFTTARRGVAPRPS